jgi:hypothetical protein
MSCKFLSLFVCVFYCFSLFIYFFASVVLLLIIPAYSAPYHKSLQYPFAGQNAKQIPAQDILLPKQDKKDKRSITQ